jgi:hypothetical protein
MKTIKITISPDGSKVKVETSGFTGKSCKEATAEIEKALGAVTSDTPTKEMYEQTRIKGSC